MPETPRLEITPQDIPEATSKAPESHITTGDIVGPYQQLARGLDQIGSGLEDMATHQAEREGAQAVTRDAQGNIQVEHMPYFGKAGDAYARAVRMAALAEGEGAAKRADIELREKYRDDPQGYQTAATAYKDATVKQYSAAAGPEVGTAVGQAIDNTTTMTYRGLLNEKERLDLQRAESRMTAGMNDAANEMKELARANAPTGEGTAFDQAHQKYQTLSDERAGNPRLAYSREEQASDMGKLESEIGAQRYLYHVDQTYKKAGYEAAAEDASDVLTNPQYKFLTEAQRQAYYNHALSEIRYNDMIRRQDIGAVQTQLTDLKARVATGDPVQPSEVWQVRDAFKKLGDDKGVAAVDIAFAHKDLHDDFGRQPLPDQLKQHDAFRGATMVRDIYQSLLDRGVPKEQAAGMAANAIFESSGRPWAFNPAGGGQGAVGYFQWRGARLEALKAYAAQQGKGYLDKDVQIDFALKEMASTEAVAGGLLRAATTPEEAARVFSQAFERGEGRDTAQRMALARSIFAGTASDGSGGPGFRSWELANQAATIKTTATRQYDAIKADWDKGKGVEDKQALRDVIEAAHDTNNIDLSTKAEALSRAQDYLDQSKQLPLDEQRTAEIEIRRQLALDTGQFAGAGVILKQLEERTDTLQKGLEKDAWGTAISIFPDKWKTPAPLNLGDPQQFAIGLAQRAQITEAIAQHEHMPGQLSALNDLDVQTVKGALANPDPAVKAAVWSTLATLPESVRNATFEKIGKSGGLNMLAEAGAGTMMSTDPEMAKSIMTGLQIMGSPKGEGILKQFEPKPGGSAGYEADLLKKLPPSAYGSETRFDPEGNYAKVEQMIKARYTFLAANSGATEYNSKLFNQAVDDVTGGIVRLNGAKTVAPVRGMDQARFDGVMAGITDIDLAGVTDANGRPVSANYLRAQGHLEAVDNGQYNINFAGPGEKPIYAYSGWGDAPGANVQRFQLNLTGRKPPPGLAPFYSSPAAQQYTELTTGVMPPGPPVPPPPVPPPAPGSRGPSQPTYDPHRNPMSVGIRG
jgi:hypothetical protein